MLPFFPSIPGQIQPQSGNDPSLQQAMLLNAPQFPSSSSAHQNPSGFNHPGQPPPLPHGQNPLFSTPSMNNFNTQNPNFNNFHRGSAGILNRPPPCFPNSPNIPPMNQMGIPNPNCHFGAQQYQAQNVSQVMAALQVLQNANLGALLQPGGILCPPNMQSGQLSLQNPMMSGNQIPPFQFPQQYPANSMQPLNMPRSSQPLMGSTGSQNPGNVGNPQMGMAGLNSNFGNAMLSKEGVQCKNQDPRIFAAPATVTQNAIQASPVVNQRSQPLVSSFGSQNHRPWNNMKQIRPQQPLVNHVHGYGQQESTNARPHNSQFHHTKNPKFMGPYNKNSGRGQQNIRERNKSMKCPTQPQTEQRRPLPLLYTEKEIQQWREARKRNFPTSDNIEKKLARRCKDQENTDEDVQLRRQQLKEVLAKQAELGVEVAEVPPSYLSETVEQVGKQKNARWSRIFEGRVLNRYNKRGRRGRDERYSKKPRAGNEAAPITGREPTLLQKLLRADIKRDKSKLLQVFRFIVLNSFFEQCPDKPLEFLSVTVKDTGSEGNDIAIQNEPSLAN